jgi:hypothetical protein
VVTSVPSSSRSMRADTPQRQPSSPGTALSSVWTKGDLRSTCSLVTARQPMPGSRLCVYSIEPRGPLSVDRPTPSTTFCSGASRTFTCTGTASGSPAGST